MSVLKSVEDVRKLLDLSKLLDVASLNTKARRNKVEDNDETEIGDFVVDDGPGPQEIIEQRDIHARLTAYVEKLPPRECQIIKLRFGLIDGHAKTLEEVGKMYGVGRERIRQLESKGLKKLRWLIMVKGKYHSIESF